MPIGWIGLGLAFLVGTTAHVLADQHDRRAEPEGDTFERTLPVGDGRHAIALPAGEWEVTARLQEEDASVLVLASTEGDHLAGLIWARIEVEPVQGGIWCRDGAARQYIEILPSGGADQDCLWIRQWGLSKNPEDYERYWSRTFSVLRDKNVEIPSRFITAGYRLASREPALTIEYSFNASDVSQQDVIAWAQGWRDQVAAAHRGEPVVPSSP